MLPTWEQLLRDDIYERAEQENVTSSHSSRISTDVNSNRDRFYRYEFTINPSNTKLFQSTEEDYLLLYNKLLRFIYTSQSEYITTTAHRYSFEYCRSRKRHMHATVRFKSEQVIAPMGLVLHLSEYLAKLLRRKIADSNVFPQYNRVQTLPFCIQIIEEKPANNETQRPNWTRDIQSWDQYIDKDLNASNI